MHPALKIIVLTGRRNLPNPEVDFIFQERLFDAGSQQGVGFDGTYFYATGGVGQDPEEQWLLLKYDTSGSLIDSRDTGADGEGLHTQVAGVYPDRAGKLYVCANNFLSSEGETQSDPKGWVLEYDDELNFITSHSLGAKITEAIWPWNGYWWEVNWSAHEIRQFNSSFSLVAAHALPDSDPAIPNWQAIFVINGIFYLNLHGQNIDAPLIRAYRWNGGGFDAVITTAAPPTANCTQGAYYHGDYIWWAERINLHVRAAIVRSTAFVTTPDGVELREDGSFELREDGTRELREVAP